VPYPPDGAKADRTDCPHPAAPRLLDAPGLVGSGLVILHAKLDISVDLRERDLNASFWEPDDGVVAGDQVGQPILPLGRRRWPQPWSAAG
jgi:hypothetical protein